MSSTLFIVFFLFVVIRVLLLLGPIPPVPYYGSLAAPSHIHLWSEWLTWQTNTHSGSSFSEPLQRSPHILINVPFLNVMTWLWSRPPAQWFVQLCTLTSDLLISVLLLYSNNREQKQIWGTSFFVSCASFLLIQLGCVLYTTAYSLSLIEHLLVILILCCARRCGHSNWNILSGVCWTAALIVLCHVRYLFFLPAFFVPRCMDWTSGTFSRKRYALVTILSISAALGVLLMYQHDPTYMVSWHASLSPLWYVNSLMFPRFLPLATLLPDYILLVCAVVSFPAAVVVQEKTERISRCNIGELVWHISLSLWLASTICKTEFSLPDSLFCLGFFGFLANSSVVGTIKGDELVKVTSAVAAWFVSLPLIFVFAHAWLVTQLANPNWMFFASVAHFASLGFLSRTFFGIAMLDQEERGKIKEN